MFSKDTASPWDNITAHCLIRQIQTNPSLMFLAAPESKIVVLIACKTTKTQAPAKMLAGDQGLITGQQDPEAGLEGLAQSASYIGVAASGKRLG